MKDEEFLKKINLELFDIYVELGNIPQSSVGYMAPEQMPQINSRQILALSRATNRRLNELEAK